MLGEFVVVCLCDIWGLPQFSLIATMCTMLCLYINFKQDFCLLFTKSLPLCLDSQNIHLGSSLLQKMIFLEKNLQMRMLRAVIQQNMFASMPIGVNRGPCKRKQFCAIVCLDPKTYI